MKIKGELIKTKIKNLIYSLFFEKMLDNLVLEVASKTGFAQVHKIERANVKFDIITNVMDVSEDLRYHISPRMMDELIRKSEYKLLDEVRKHIKTEVVEEFGTKKIIQSIKVGK